MKRLLVVILLTTFFLSLPGSIHAIVDPRTTTNNFFGIHVIDENDLKSAQSLVNSNGGDWGYVTMVIREDDRNINKWQETFDKLRELHLIPIIRLATKVDKGVWIKPRTEDIEPWVEFLSNLNWVTKNRYVILFNEPNHAKEWGGSINPGEYATIASAFIKQLKSASPDFFILPAGLDSSADTTKLTLHPKDFWWQMHQTEPNIFKGFDGWTTHAYPNPNFSAPPTATGRKSITSFTWELKQVESLGISKDIPIFITETGWAHREGKNIDRSYRTATTLTSYYTQAFTKYWQQPNIIAVTPFLLNYQDDPFSHFSWTKYQSQEVYPFYSAIQALPKNSGQPAQEHAASWLPGFLPDTLIKNQTYRLRLEIKNSGQTYWTPETTTFKVSAGPDLAVATTSESKITKPREIAPIFITVTPTTATSSARLQVSANDNGVQLPVAYLIFRVQDTGNLTLNLRLWLNQFLHNSNFQILNQ